VTAVPHESATGALEVLRTRSVVRHYTGEPVEESQIQQLVTAMLAAPSASNKQAWAFVMVRRRALVRGVRAFSPGIIGDPALILVACVDNRRAADDPHVREVATRCVAMAVQNFLLAAHALGLGACPVSSFLSEPVQLLLDLPPQVDPVFVVPVGHPAGRRQSSQRRSAEEVVHHDTWTA
jgi:nitroreductase